MGSVPAARQQPNRPLSEKRSLAMRQSRRSLVAFALAALLLAPVAAVAAEASGVVNVNTASAAQLELLPRIGPSVAQRIVEHREENGGKFASLEDLMLVRGIGERTFALLQPYVALSGETTLEEKVRVPRTAASAEEER
jgi:competence protein ComEA